MHSDIWGHWLIPSLVSKRPSATRSARDSLNRATSDAMFKIIAVAVIGILGGIGFFDIGQEAYTLAALLLGIGALLDYSQRGRRAPSLSWHVGHGADRGSAPPGDRARIKPLGSLTASGAGECI